MNYSFNTIKNLGIGALLLILLVIVAIAFQQTYSSVDALKKIIKENIPAQQNLAQINQLLTTTDHAFALYVRRDRLTPDEAVEPLDRLRAQLRDLSEQMQAEGLDTVGINKAMHMAGIARTAFINYAGEEAQDAAIESLNKSLAALADLETEISALAATAHEQAWQENITSRLQAVMRLRTLAAQGVNRYAKRERMDLAEIIGHVDHAIALLEQMERSTGVDSAIVELRDLTQAVRQYRAAIHSYGSAEEQGADEMALNEERETAYRLWRGVEQDLDKVNKILSKHIFDTQSATIEAGEAGQQAFLWLTVIALVVAMAISYLFSKALSSSIRLLAEGTRHFATGDLGYRLVVRGNDELAQLGKSFNQMAENLEELVKNVHMAGIQVASSATEIAATMKQQEASASEQAATANQIVASTREISSTAADLLDSMDEVARGSSEAASLSEQSAHGLSEMEDTMKQMGEASRDISEKLAVLNEKAGTISSVVTTINKVADQTNLLSLNAAIEAEKAGEYGVGFGVVAKEIRRLADQTAVATWDIEQVVKEIQAAVSSGVMGMDKFTEEVRRGVEVTKRVGDQLSNIVEQVQALAPHFESVHEGMQSQTQGAEQINLAIGQLSDTVSSTADSLRESGRVVSQLNEAATRLQEAVGNFKIGED